MDRQRAVRTTEALICLAFDQIGHPEGELARSRANEWLTRHHLSRLDFPVRISDRAESLGLFPPRAPRPAPRATPIIYKHHATYRPYVDQGVCCFCGSHFRRGKWHQGSKARYCSPECHAAKRRVDAKERMRRNRAAKAR